MIQDLNKDSFFILAAKYFDRPVYLMDELHDDLKRIRHIKVHVNRYLKGYTLKHRTALNHIIVLMNAFGSQHAVRMLFYAMDEEQLPVIKSLLMSLKVLPEVVSSINGRDIRTNMIDEDREVLEEIEKEQRCYVLG